MLSASSRCVLCLSVWSPFQRYRPHNGCVVSGVLFSAPPGANMKNSILEDSHMAGVVLRVACMRNASLKRCDLQGAVLAGTDLEVYIILTLKLMLLCACMEVFSNVDCCNLGVYLLLLVVEVAAGLLFKTK